MEGKTTGDSFAIKFREMGKRRQMAGWSPLVPFLFMLLLVLPLFIVIIIPTTFLFLLFKKTGKAKEPVFFDEEKDDVKGHLKKGLKKKNEREFHLVIYGATGYTGKLAARYAAKQYAGKDVRWAIAGRNPKKLEKVKEELVQIEEGNSSLSIIVADSSDSKALEAMVKRTMVVASAVGPFAKYGSRLVGMCASCGTDYVDTTGEADWVKHIIARVTPTAKASGSRIVNFCAHDCIPWDLTVQQHALRLKEKHNQDLKKIEIVDEIRGNISGGTIETIFNLIQNPLPRPPFGFNPWLADKDGKRCDSYKCKLSNIKFVSWSNVSNEWTGLFLMADMNGKLVQRSNILCEYGKSIQYCEGMTHPSFMAAFVASFSTILLAVAAFNPILGYIFREIILPKPGQGSGGDHDKGYLKVAAVGTGEKGAKVHSVLGFYKDPGYADTGRMLVESGLMLALENDKLRIQDGGVWTTAACLGAGLLDRLVATGCTFEIRSS
eukprot:jgi/Bigna1/139660/aug1.51_g14368